ncbi:hypothetical protein PV10_09095 [Exophiala mesophila]|uniref:SMP-30/Gluconolactonase/LRE-like region domain-containing protein n=1 Tax=Exophiala mesophila TaxID=212818 RepID=A0A0D1Z2L9_EXOME|nr:uncharacterized protein PV10_09095 [Exophiala mesophila]KIV88174.1 hypothetical protein PV10_09095 [Exophiala mesophila]
MSGKLLALPLLVAALGALYSNPNPILDRFAGREAHARIHTDHLGHGALNNDKCWKFPVGQACEDVRIHYPSGTAILACGYPETRNAFYPPLHRHDMPADKNYHEYFIKYDLNTNTTTKLRIEGLDESHDLILHGIDFLEPKDDPSKLYMFSVNHGRKGETIALFSYTIGSDVLTYIREFSHSKIKTPNAVAATGLDSFFITNDHYFYGGFLGGIARTLEGKFGPWKWASDVVYCSSSASGAELDCRTVSPPNAHPSANGALLVDGGKTLMINDIVHATTTVYDVDPVTKQLTTRKVVQLGAAADNLSEIPGSGDVAVCVFPDLIGLIGALTGDVTRPDVKSDAAILRLVKSKDYEPEVLYWDDGSLITVLTGAAVDPVRHRLIAGGVVAKQFIVCDITGVKL